MPRLKLDPLPRYAVETEITVRTTDLNYGGHLGNDRLLALVHEARVDFLARYGLSEMDCAGVSLIMGDAAIVFQGEAFAGDRIRIETTAAEPGGSGFRLFHRLTRTATAKPVALVETGMICFDYRTRRIRPLPEPVRVICTPRPQSDTGG